MYAVISAVLFAIGFVLHVLGAKLGTDATGYGFLGLVALAVHFVATVYGWRGSTRTVP